MDARRGASIAPLRASNRDSAACGWLGDESDVVESERVAVVVDALFVGVDGVGVVVGGGDGEGVGACGEGDAAEVEVFEVACGAVGVYCGGDGFAVDEDVVGAVVVSFPDLESECVVGVHGDGEGGVDGLVWSGEEDVAFRLRKW